VFIIDRPFVAKLMLLAAMTMNPTLVTAAEMPLYSASAGPGFLNFRGGEVLNLTFKSKIDGSLQPLLVKVPEDYNTGTTWPLLVTLHGLGDSSILVDQIESMVQIGPYGRGSVWFTGIGREDVFECIETAKRIFPIDEDRIYLCGFSMGAVATFKLGLSYPDMWAACVPVCGSCEDIDLVENGRSVAFWIHTGARDRVLGPGYSRRAYQRARKLGFCNWYYSKHKQMGHSFEINWKQVEKWLSGIKRMHNPREVSFCTRSLNASKAYWIEITGMETYGLKARIKAKITGQNINIVTENISSYTLRLNSDLVDLGQAIRVVENGKVIFDGLLNNDGLFVKKEKECNRPIFKRPGLCGPLWDIYTSSCVLVYGTDAKEQALIDAARSCAISFSDPRWMDKVSFRIIPDTAVSKQDLERNNLVLFGNERTNRILAAISDRLPIRMSGNCVAVGDAKYYGQAIGYVLIFQNPLNPDKYVAVFSGNTPETLDCFDKIWPCFNSTPKDIDYGIFELAETAPSVRWLVTGCFGGDWDWQPPPDHDDGVTSGNK